MDSRDLPQTKDLSLWGVNRLLQELYFLGWQQGMGFKELSVICRVAHWGVIYRALTESGAISAGKKGRNPLNFEIPPELERELRWRKISFRQWCNAYQLDSEDFLRRVKKGERVARELLAKDFPTASTKMFGEIPNPSYRVRKTGILAARGMIHIRWANRERIHEAYHDDYPEITVKAKSPVDAVRILLRVVSASLQAERLASRLLDRRVEFSEMISR